MATRFDFNVTMFFGKNKITPANEMCCGCSACVQACTHHAITMHRDVDGFLYPVLDASKCVDCGSCESVCPMVFSAKVKNTKIQDAYWAVNNDSTILSKSSSGGIFTIIAKWVLDKGGIVYGAAFDENMQLQHIGIEEYSALYKLRGSKYLQSDNGNVFSCIRNELKKGRWVYYTGTGCQVAGLRLYLRKNFSTLICSDLICHGTPSQKAFDNVVHLLEAKYKGKLVRYSFRDKSVNGWSCSSSSSLSINGNIKNICYDSIMNAYFNAFSKGVMNRESCYNCPYATMERTGDITLSDYWGIRKYHQIKGIESGVSAVLVNTDNGRILWSELSKFVNCGKTKQEWIATSNRNLIEHTPRPVTRDYFYSELEKSPNYLVNHYQDNKYKNFIKFQIKRFCRKYKLLNCCFSLVRKCLWFKFKK